MDKLLFAFKSLLFVIVYTLFVPLDSFAYNYVNDLSKDSKISLLTCSTGSELYSCFGHSAIRVVDDSLNIDIVFNYGTFNFRTPNFYLKFLNGDLNYMLAASYFSDFYNSYKRDGRGVSELYLNMNYSQRDSLWLILCKNMQPQNRNYRYDFFFDNCATRIRDRIFDVCTDCNNQNLMQLSGKSFRWYLHQCNDASSWTAQGIDLLLGKKSDEIATNWQSVFIPEYLEKVFLENGVGDTSRTLLVRPEIGVEKQWFTPIFLAFIILAMAIVASVLQFLNCKQFKILDVILYISCGLVGLLMWYMWMFTKHYVTQLNFNVLWASPMLIVYCISLVFNRRIFAKVISIINILAIVTFLILAVCGVQYFPSIAFPISIAILIRQLMSLLKQ